MDRWSEEASQLPEDFCRRSSSHEDLGFISPVSMELQVCLVTSFLLNRFRVLDKCNKTSFELATGHGYHGKLALFGESVLFKKMVKCKGTTCSRGAFGSESAHGMTVTWS